MKSLITIVKIIIILSGSYAKSTILNCPELSSTKNKIHLIELFSSEGCSSCPPAEKWLRQKLSDDKIWTQFTPLEYHIDYWNQLGWVDPFSQKKFSQKQRNYAQAQANPRVFTPAFFVNGEIQHGYPKITNIKQNLSGVLTLSKDNGAYVVMYKPHHRELTTLKKHNIQVAYFANKMNVQVPRGENAGQLLKHNFVVIKHMTLDAKVKNGTLYARTPNFTKPKSLTSKPMGVAAWVSNTKNLKVLQSIGGMCE